MDIYGELLRTLLEKRGITDADSAGKFLTPDYERDFHDPFLMRDMKKACERILKAVDNDEKIVVYADYDCDGIPGAVILRDFFKKIDYKNFSVYIPKRNSEGYGLSMEPIKEFINDKVKLLITVDLGITAVEEVEVAKKGGIDVIITDHHLPKEKLPKAYAILNPKVDDYPEKMLCGAGVAFKLVQAMAKLGSRDFAAEDCLSEASSAGKKLREAQVGWEKWTLDMAGLATLSDMVPLLGENRAIAYFGLKVLRKTPRPGLQKLFTKIKLDQKYLTEDDVGFMIVPKLNAASRMDDPRRAFELLSTDDVAEAGALAEHLSKINDERKQIVANIMREVNKKFERAEERTNKEVIVIGNPEWRVGVLGLVAGKMCDEYQKPVFVWGKDENDCLKGSCRSPGSVSVVELMGEAKDYFSEWGGHELAGGFTVHSDKIHFLEDGLCGALTKLNSTKKESTDSNTYSNHDLKSGLHTVNMKNWREIEKLAPFGHSNEKPVFLFESVKVENLKKFGKNGGEHLEIIFSDGEKHKATAISFFSTENSFKAPVLSGGYANLLATFDLSRFRGREELRLRVVDII